MKIPIAKPLGKEEADAAHKTILSGWVTQGPKVAEFEENLLNMLAQNMQSLFQIVQQHCT